MSSSNDTGTTVRLVADGNGPSIRIRVIDGRFRVVAEGLGRVEVALAPGLYTVRFQAALVVRDIYAALDPDREVVRVEAPDLPFSTPIPLQRTRTTLAEHERHAGEQSQRIHQRRGAGSQLFVFVRALGGPARERVAYGLTLHDIAGTTLADFARDGARSPPHQHEARWAGCTIELDPGAYRLRVRRAGRVSLEQIVVTRRGWQTQVFLLHDISDEGAGSAPADLFDAGILMTRMGGRFDPARADFRQTELVRLGLAEGRVVVSADDLGRMAWATQDNPMLGIYGAHLLLSAPRPDRGLLRQVAEALRRLVGAHPDVDALGIALGAPAADAPVYQAPPMLRSSWEVIVRESVRRPEIVPVRSFAACVAAQLWTAGVWLTWQTPVATLQVEANDGLDLALLRRRLPQIVSVLASPRSMGDAEHVAESYGLNTIERYLFDYVADVALSPRPARMAAGADLHDERLAAERAELLSDAAITQALGVPLGVLRQAGAGLIRKLAPVDVAGLVDAALPHLERLAQLDALGLAPDGLAVAALRRACAVPSGEAAFPLDATPAERAACAERIHACLEQDEDLALTLDALLREDPPRLSDLQFVAALVAPLARTTYARMGCPPGALADALRRYFQAEPIRLRPWQAHIPAASWWPQLFAEGAKVDPHNQIIAMVHSLVADLFRLDRPARQAALADRHKRALHDQALRAARRARLARPRRLAFADAYIAAIQALAPLADDLLSQDGPAPH